MFDGPFTFVEAPGEDPWFGPWHRKARFQFGPQWDGHDQMMVRFERIPQERKTVKVMGFSALYPAMMVPCTARRVMRHDLSQWPHWAHENSWRYIAHLKPGRPGTVRYHTYTYRAGLGAIGPSTPRDPEKVFMGEAKVGEKAVLDIEVREDHVLYTTLIAGERRSHEEPLACSPWLYWRHFAHSSGVQSDTPGRIVFTAWR